MLTPLMKKAAGNNARLVSAKDCDYAVWTRLIYRAIVDYVRKMACPQQLGIGVASGVELKHVTAQIWLEERLASGRVI
jgi:hypothetical protein